MDMSSLSVSVARRPRDFSTAARDYSISRSRDSVANAAAAGGALRRECNRRLTSGSATLELNTAAPSALRGLVVLPGMDRVVSTNSSMHDADIFSEVTYPDLAPVGSQASKDR
jgi:hypothetical protein